MKEPTKKQLIKDLLTILRKENGLKEDDVDCHESDERTLYHTQDYTLLQIKKL